LIIDLSHLTYNIHLKLSFDHRLLIGRSYPYKNYFQFIHITNHKWKEHLMIPYFLTLIDWFTNYKFYQDTDMTIHTIHHLQSKIHRLFYHFRI
jgi:hypothetical protein